ncbi:hypothetical protein OEZ86_000930 [Tetradesmus obliquus]|nr:hypothetical protein OEZ86_000930 [Tetradesmus obliquus]
MQFLKALGNVLQQSQRAARSLERSVQEVVEVLQPGPLGATAARWDARRRAEAEQAVQQALDNWQALQQQHRQQQQEQWTEGPAQHSELWNAPEQHHSGVQQQQHEGHANS